MLYEVRVLDKYGKVQSVIPASEVRRIYWEKEFGESNIGVLPELAAKNPNHEKRETPKENCKECEKLFPRITTGQKYCSASCRKNYWNKHVPRVGPNKPLNGNPKRNLQLAIESEVEIEAVSNVG